MVLVRLGSEFVLGWDIGVKFTAEVKVWVMVRAWFSFLFGLHLTLSILGFLQLLLSVMGGVHVECES